MKLILPILCSILLIGCGDSSNTSVVANNTKTAEAKTTEAPIAPEASTAAEPETLSVTKSDAVTPTAAVVVPQKSKENTAVKTTVPVNAATVDGKVLFAQKCASCHGNKGEKPALNKSQIIADFTEQQIKDALNGYKEGAYGKEMKALMQGQVKGLNNGQIDALAKDIPHL
jgi:cytochrome c553